MAEAEDRQAEFEEPPPTRRHRGWIALAALPLLLVLVLFAWSRLAPAERSPDILLVSIDTLRADRLGCYGYAGGETPILDVLAARGVLFEAAMAPTPLTGPSHASMLTGLIPPHHGVHVNTAHVLPDAVQTLAEALGEEGYQTGAFIGGMTLQHGVGLHQGFDTYDDKLPRRTKATSPTEWLERNAEQTLVVAREWMASSDPARPVFAFVHLFDPHLPYEQKLPGESSESYDGEIAYVDRELGSFLSHLEQAPRWNGMLTVVTSDHGESLGEHGENTHGYFVYESTLHVPLIVHWPDRLTPRRLSTPVSVTDVSPTILELAGLRPMRNLDGVSLVATMERSAPEPRPLYFESRLASLTYGWASLRGIRSGDLKYISAPAPELYDLGRDPKEEHNLWDRRRSEAAALAEHLTAIRDRAFETRELDQETIERLAAVGYLSVPTRDPIEAADPADPKDCLETWMGLQAAHRLYLQRRHEEALSIMQGFESLCRGSAFYYLRCGLYASGAGDLELAVASYLKCLALEPENQGGHLNLASAHSRLGDLQQALEVIDALLEIDPDNIQAHLKAADLSMRHLDDPARAKLHMERFLELAPDHPTAEDVRRALAQLADLREEIQLAPGAEDEGD